MSEEPLCVLVGKWQCNDSGNWVFVMTQGIMAKFVQKPKDLSFEKFYSTVCEKFGIDLKKQKISFSFWCPNISDVCSQSRMPPVSISSSDDYADFLSMREIRSGLNICLTMEDVDAVPEKEDIICLANTQPGDSSMLALLHSVEASYGTKSQTQPSGCVEMGGKCIGRGEPEDDDQNSDGSWDELLTAIEEQEQLAKQIRNPATVGTMTVESETIRLRTPTTLNEMVPATQQQSPTFELGIEDLSANLVPSDVSLEDVLETVDQSLGDLVDVNNPDFEDQLPNIEMEAVDDFDEPLFVKRVFDNKEQLSMALAIFAIERFFCYKIYKSDPGRLIAHCVDTHCRWRLYAVNLIDSEKMQIRTMVQEHTCGIESRSRYVEKATPRVLGELLKSRYANGRKGPRACEIPDILLAELKLTVNYMRAWHSKEVAMAIARGTEEENYKMLETYLILLQKTNPGTRTNIQKIVDRNGGVHFKYVYVAFGASILGYPYLRKVVVLDATQLKGKYKGCLATACCQDGNMRIFPLAFGVLDSENEPSWTWFLENLKQFVDDEDGLVFVSDRHLAIRAAISRVFPLSHHACCVVHLNRNVKHNYKCEGLAGMVSRAARAYTLSDFQMWWREIEGRSPGCAAFLREMGFAQWSRYHCPHPRYNLMSSNIAESLNNVIGKAVDYPIITLFEYVRTFMMRWFATRRYEAKNWNSVCTNAIEALLLQNLRTSRYFTFTPASESVFQVTDLKGHIETVDVEFKTCTCNVFQALKFPCPHALAVAQAAGVETYDLVDAVYKTVMLAKAYENVIMPVPEVKECESSGDALLPPFARRPPGRPPKLRIPSRGEFYDGGGYKPPRCGRCGKHGHNKVTCRTPLG